MRRSLFSLCTIAILLGLTAFASPCLAQDDDDQTAEDEEVEEEEEEEEEEEVTWVKVPKRLRDQGYKIDFDGERIPLDKEKFRSSDPNWLKTLYLLSSDHRIIDSERTYLTANALRNIEPDTFRIGLHGGTTDVHGEAFEKIFVGGQMSNTTVDLIYQPAAFGFLLSTMSVYTTDKTDFGNSELTAEYGSNQVRLGITFDTAPFPNRRGILGRTHAMFYAGALTSTSTAKITDGVVTIEDEDDATGGFGGLELRWPVMQFWIGTRLDYSYHLIEFKTLDMKTNSMQRHFSGGASYAF